MTHGVYLVTGSRRYRGHEPGTTFEAVLPRGAEQRAFQRGDIRLLRYVTPSIEPGALTLPDDWPPSVPPPKQTGAPEGASFVTEGG